MVGERATPQPSAARPTLTIVDLAEARVVARIPGGDDWGIGPARKVLVVRVPVGEQTVLRAYTLATGRPIGEFTSPLANFVPAPLMYRESLSSWIAPDDRRMAVRLLKGPYQRQEMRLVLWSFEDSRTTPIPIDGNWEPNSIPERWMYFDGDGTRLLISGSQKTGPNASRPVVELWDLGGPRRLMTTLDAAPKLTLGVPKLLYHPGQQAFATVHEQNPEGIGAILWDVATGKVIGRYKGYQAGLSEDGAYLEVKDGGSSNLVSLRTHEVRAFPKLQFHMVFGVPERRTAVTSPAVVVQRRGGPSLFDLTLTDVETGRTRAVLHNQWALAGAFTPDGRRLATVMRGEPSALNIWEVETGKLIRSVPLRNAVYRSVQRGMTTERLNVADVQFAPDGRRLSFNLNDRFRVLDVESGRLVAIDRPGHRAAIRALDVSPDGALVASAGDDAAVCLWEAASGRFVAMLEEEAEAIAAVAFSPDGTRLAARTATGRVRLWTLERTAAGGRIGVVAAPARDTTSLGPAAGATATSGPVFVDEGRLVAFGSGDGTIALRDATNGRSDRVLKPESGRAAVTALAAGRDGTRLASGDADGVVRLWDLSTQDPPARFATEQGAIRAVALARDMLAAAGGAVELWDVGRGRAPGRAGGRRRCSCPGGLRGREVAGLGRRSQARAPRPRRAPPPHGRDRIGMVTPNRTSISLRGCHRSAPGCSDRTLPSSETMSVSIRSSVRNNSSNGSVPRVDRSGKRAPARTRRRAGPA